MIKDLISKSRYYYLVSWSYRSISSETEADEAKSVTFRPRSRRREGPHAMRKLLLLATTVGVLTTALAGASWLAHEKLMFSLASGCIWTEAA
jgi:hypothetical protein